MIRTLFLFTFILLSPNTLLGQGVLSPGVNAPEQPAQQADPALKDISKAFQTLQAYYEKNSKPDEKEVAKLVEQVELGAEKLLSDASIVSDSQQVGVYYAIMSFAMSMRVDGKVYGDKIRTWSATAVSKFKGSPVASIGEAFVLQLDMATLSSDDFLTRIAAYQKEYPKSPMPATLFSMYVSVCISLKKTDDAKKALDEGVKQYPTEPTLVRLSLPGKEVELKSTSLDGKDFDLKGLAGKVVVLDFWASWCQPCIDGMPEMLKFYEDYKDQGLEIVGVSIDGDVDALEQAVSDNKIPWTVLFEASRKVRATFLQKFGIQGIPTFVVIGKDGKVAGMPVGSMAELEAQVEEALKK